MSHLTRERWPVGWIPSDDDVNGRKDGLLRMDNLTLDENGVLAIAKGTQKVNATEFTGFIHTLYSKYFNTTKWRFAGLGDGRVIGSSDNFASTTEFITGSFAPRAAFATALGHVLIASGDKKVRFDGTNTFNIGLTRPQAPLIESLLGPVVVVADAADWNSTVLIEGDNLDTGVSEHAKFDTAETRGIIKVSRTVNTLALDDNSVGTENDRFQAVVRIGDTDNLKKLRIEFIMDDLDTPTEYFFFEWSNEKTPSDFRPGLNAWSTLEARRHEFTRVGNDSTKGWDSLIGFRIEILTTAVITDNIIDTLIFFGGEKGPLGGRIEYLQVNVHNTGSYQAKSAAGIIAKDYWAFNGRTLITPAVPSEAHVNEIWIYRRNAETNVDVTGLGSVKKLDQFYRIKVLNSTTGLGQFTDELSDEDALAEAEIIDFRIASIKDVVDEIFSISELVFGRVLYLTRPDIIISSELDLDSYNPLHTVRLSGNAAEANLWIIKIGEGTVLVGTTEDIYVLSGTFQELPNGSIDVNVRGLGVKYPPISLDYCFDHGTIYYMAADGWRSIAGSETQLLNGNLDKLFRGEVRHGMSPVQVFPIQVRYACAVYKNELWTFNPLQDGSRTGFIYDFLRQYWRLHKLEAISLFVEEDGILLGGFGGGSGNFIRILDTGDNLDGVTGQDVVLQTVFDDDLLPRNRKDIFTLKLTADTGNKPVQILYAKDKGNFVSLGNFTFDGLREQLIEVANLIGIGKRFSLRIVGTDLNVFKLYSTSLEYDPRPEQLNYLRIQNTNLGTLARKRFISYAFVVDSLGATIRFTPYIDNVSGTPTLFSTSAKLTYLHFFIDEQIGTDIGGIIDSDADNPFEFYQLNLEETVSEKLPTPTKFLIIPSEDYGSPNRKRHSSYKFQIHTRGGNVRFTPRLDGTDKTPITYNTTEKRTVEYYFSEDTIAIDIGGKLESLVDTPFEFYGVIRPQHIEVLPPRLKEFRIPETNYGHAAKKRIRTMPMEINTNGSDVTFTPIVDNISSISSTFNTPNKQTVLHYFTNDSFGIDYSGELIGNNPFEFYGLLKPEDVEVLPVAKKFDQIGPISLIRLGKLQAFRIKVIAGDGALPYKIYIEDTLRLTGSIDTIANTDKVYEAMKFAKTLAGTVFRIEFGPTSTPFHRYYVELKFNISGQESDAKWVKLK